MTVYSWKISSTTTVNHLLQRSAPCGPLGHTTLPSMLWVGICIFTIGSPSLLYSLGFIKDGSYAKSRCIFLPVAIRSSAKKTQCSNIVTRQSSRWEDLIQRHLLPKVDGKWQEHFKIWKDNDVSSHQSISPENAECSYEVDLASLLLQSLSLTAIGVSHQPKRMKDKYGGSR